MAAGKKGTGRPGTGTKRSTRPKRSTRRSRGSKNAK